MAEDADLFDVVPPSPIATSTQLSQPTAGGFFPPLPQLPELQSGTSEPPVSGSRQLELSLIAEIRLSQGSAGSRSTGGRGQQPVSARTSFTGLGDWVIRPVESVSQQQPLQLQGPREDEDVVEIDDSSNSASVVSLDRDSPVEEIVVDSDSAQSISDVIERPENPEPPVDNVDHQPGVSDIDVAREETVSVVHHDNEAPGADDGNSELVRESDGTSRDPDSRNTEVPVTIDVGTIGTPVHVQSQPQVFRAIVSSDSSPADFRSPKRKRLASPAKSSHAEKKQAEDEDEEDGECCPICFEPWTTSGGHRLCSLKCGHLFGQSCIEKWLKGQGGKCPHCNAKAKRQDIRVLYAKSVKAVDTTEQERALKDLDKERELRRKAEMEGAQLRLQYQMAIEENNKMRHELDTLREQLRNAGSGVPTLGIARNPETTVPGSLSQLAGRFVLDRSIKIWDAGNCRVMSYCPSLATLVVSQPSSSPLFPGFGVKKISALDFKTSQYLTIHSKAIRDLAFHPSVEDGMLLSCGLDKKVKMTSLLSNAVVQTYDTPLPAWSCVWNAEDRNYFFAGLQNGLVLEFDIRNTIGPVKELNSEGSRSPVASLLYIDKDLHAEFRSGGLMIGQLDKVTFLESVADRQHRLHLLPLEGLLTSLSLEPQTRHILASYRPTARHPIIRHQLCEMFNRNISTDPSVVDTTCSCNVVHTFHGGRTQTVLSRSVLLTHPADSNRLLVCGGDETNNTIHLWDSGTGQLTQSLMVGGVTVDMCSFRLNNTTYLAALTDKLCKVFKWT